MLYLEPREADNPSLKPLGEFLHENIAIIQEELRLVDSTSGQSVTQVYTRSTRL